MYLGIGLIVFSLLTLLIKIEVNVQTPDFPDFETFNIGFLFAPLIGSFGLASLALGIAEASLPKKTRLCFLPIGIVYIAASVTVWMAIRFGFNAPFWWVYASAFFIAIIIAGFIGVKQFTGKNNVERILPNQMTRIAVFCILVAVPFLFVTVLWLFYSFF